MKKVLLAFLLIFLFIVSTFSLAYAESGNSFVPMASNYKSATVNLNIQNGTATIRGNLTGINGVTTKATVHLYLQQYSNDEWKDYADWLASDTGVDCVVVKTISVPKGYKYRAKASCYAYNGAKSEHITKYSSQISY